MSRLKPHPRVMFFDLYAGGHHAQFIEQLARFWISEKLPGSLEIAVPPRLVDQSKLLRDSGLPLHQIQELRLSGNATLDLLRSDFVHGRQIRRLVKERRPDHLVAMYFDHTQLSFAFDLRFRYPVELSGIYFRPSFHYSQFGGPHSRGGLLTNLRKQLVLRSALNNPHAKYLFSLDPYAVEWINKWSIRARALPLPDGADVKLVNHDPARIREKWGVMPDRAVALLFGAIDARKGVSQVLEAVRQLPAASQRRLCLALIGRQVECGRGAISEAIRMVRDLTDAQVVVDDRYVDSQEIQGVFAASDIVLLPYQRHVGSSNVLVRAAAARKPVLGPDFGLLGRYIRIYKLGAAVDTQVPELIADALESFLQNGEIPFDRDAAHRFASDHSDEQFARVFWNHLLGGPPDV